MLPEFKVTREWNGKPIRLTVHNWVIAQILRECSAKDLEKILSNQMILG